MEREYVRVTLRSSIEHLGGAEMSDPTFSPRELDVMAVLWDIGAATVPEVRSQLAEEIPYTTVQTVLRTLEAKGYVSHAAEGRFHRYRALVARETASRGALRRMLAKLFAGSPELLLSQLVSQRDVSEEQVRRMKELLEEVLAEEER
jgi:predicted transcriptional regulator